MASHQASEHTGGGGGDAGGGDGDAGKGTNTGTGSGDAQAQQAEEDDPVRDPQMEQFQKANEKESLADFLSGLR